MCGRFALRLTAEEIQDLHDYDLYINEWVNEDAFVPRYNIAPRTFAPVVRLRERNEGMQENANAGSSERSVGTNAGASSSGSQRPAIIHSMKWGLVPNWSKYEDKTLSTTNARAENLLGLDGGGMWASLKGRKRCAVICQGYYEWLTKGKEKLPHFTKFKDRKLMLMAGLYDCVILEGQTEPLWTFTIVTTGANKDFEWLHERQPVFLSTPEAVRAWLDTSSQQWTKELAGMLAPYSDEKHPLECYPVPKEVGRVGTESSTFIEPLATRRDGIQAMFSKQKEAQQMSQSLSPVSGKRKRSPEVNQPSASQQSSDPSQPDKAEDDEIVVLDSDPRSSQSSPKKAKVQGKEETVSPTSPASSPTKGRTKSPSKKPGVKRALVREGEKNGARITSFFSKAGT